MTGPLITATDYNSVQSTIASVLGLGSGIYGYGQTLVSSQVLTKRKITVTQWKALKTDIIHALQFQTGNDYGMNTSATITEPVAGHVIVYTDFLLYQNYANLAYTNALVSTIPVAPYNQGARDTLGTYTYTAPWNTEINEIAAITFNNPNSTFAYSLADSERFYFNAGGKIEFTSSLTGDTSSKGTTWANMLSSMGTISFGYSSTSCSGTGAGSAIGYSTLTSVDQLIFTKLAPSGVYSANRVLIYARQSNVGQIVFTLKWKDDSTGNPDEMINGTLSSVVRAWHASIGAAPADNISIPTPNFSSSEQTIFTADYNALQARIASVMGLGVGKYGYGQSLASVQLPLATNLLYTHWKVLKTDIIHALQFQSGNDLGMDTSATIPEPNPGYLINYTDYVNYQARANSAYTNHVPPILPISPYNQGTRESLGSNTYAALWNTVIQQTVTISFSAGTTNLYSFTAADAARFYFNTASTIEFTSSLTSQLGVKGTTWANMLSSMGTISFAENATTCSGTGSNSAIGFTNLTSVNQIIFTKMAPVGAYSANKFIIYARISAPGQVVFTLYWRDDSTGVIDEAVTGTVTSTIQAWHASIGAAPANNVGIPLPLYTVSAISGVI